jgi:hypothetical protein
VVEWDRFSHTAHVWHLDDRGDIHQMAFVVPPGTRPEMVAKALRYYAHRWIDKKIAEGWKPNLGSFRCYGPMPSLDCPGEEEYVVEARWYREKPLVMPAAQLEEYVNTPPKPTNYAKILAHAAANPTGGPDEDVARRAEEEAKNRERIRHKRGWKPSVVNPLVAEALKEEDDG